jgi:hypothetical protein
MVGLVALLLALIALAVPLEASQPVHVHDAGTAGLYNEDHVLASLDSLTGDLLLPDAVPTVVVPHVARGSQCAAVRRPAPFPCLSDSRAPPAAS